MNRISPLAWLAICFLVFAIHPLAAQTLDNANQAKLAQRDQLWSEAIKIANDGKLNEATELLNQVYAIEESVFGAAHAKLLTTLDVLAQVTEDKHDVKALIDIRRHQHRMTVQLYGRADYRTQDANRAITAAKRSATRSPEDRTRLQRAHRMNATAVKRYGEGDYSGAIPAAEQAAEIYKQVLGEQHPLYATSLYNLGAQYKAMADYARAEQLYTQAIKIRKQVLGKQHPDYATSLSNLALLYVAMGNYARGELLSRQAMEIRKQVLGEQHSDYAASLSNLAGLYHETGEYSRAEPLFRQAMEINKQVLGEQHPDYARSLSNLAAIYDDMVDYARAEPLHRQAMEIRKRVLGEQNHLYASSLSNLASLYRAMGDDARAEPLITQAMEINKQVFGEQHPAYATSLNSLAVFYDSMGDYARAEPLYRQAMEILKQVLGEQHPTYANSLNNLALLYRAMGNYVRAEPLFRQAMEIRKHVLGEQHPAYASSLSNLAGLYVAMGEYASGEPLYRQSASITLENLELTADVQSQRQQVSMAESLRYRLDSYLSLGTREPKFQADAYAALLRWKGSVWQRQQRQRLLIDQPELKPRFAALQSVSSKLSTLILNPPDPKQLEAWHRQLDELTDEREKLERDLSLASVAFRQTQQPVTPDLLRESLPDGTMLLDFLEYNHFTPADQEQQTKDTWQRRLLVHLVRADQHVQAIDLGDAGSLNALVQTWRRDLGQSADAATAADELRKRIWLPIEKHLEGITAVYVSPDGLLGQFPLAALPGKQSGSYLIEEMAIIMLPIPQGLPEMAFTSKPSADPSEDRICLVGGVDYEQINASETHTTPSTPDSSAGTLMLAARGGQWQAFSSLPGTVSEIDTIESMIRKHRPAAEIKILQGGFATEAAFSEIAPQNRYLHMATHGFFAPETVQNAMMASTPDRMMAVGESLSPKLTGQHPDLLSGLVFAGANQKPDSESENDGILTAAEVQSLDLRNVKLAVLSACETGLGKTAGGEGIIGLQRAFQLAGAKTTITSLWQVDDAATQALMVAFYRNLLERKFSKLESLRQAQLWLLNNPNVIEGRSLTTRGSVRPINITAETKSVTNKPTRSLPAYWAAFQLSGDPR